MPSLNRGNNITMWVVFLHDLFHTNLFLDDEILLRDMSISFPTK